MADQTATLIRREEVAEGTMAFHFEAQTLLILVALGCFGSYKIDYSDEFARVFVWRTIEKEASVAPDCKFPCRAFVSLAPRRESEESLIPRLLHAQNKAACPRTGFWRGTATESTTAINLPAILYRFDNSSWRHLQRCPFCLEPNQ
jgi:hypothetical protein